MSSKQCLFLNFVLSKAIIDLFILSNATNWGLYNVIGEKLWRLLKFFDFVKSIQLALDYISEIKF